MPIASAPVLVALTGSLDKRDARDAGRLRHRHRSMVAVLTPPTQDPLIGLSFLSPKFGGRCGWNGPGAASRSHEATVGFRGAVTAKPTVG